MKRSVPYVVLLLALLCALGFAPGSQLEKEEVLRKASFIPELEEYYSKPSVQVTATYEGARDLWWVELTEATSGAEIARFTVSDDSGEVGGVEVYPGASEVEYPRLSERKAVKLAAASPEVRDELSEHGTYTTKATYEDGEWTVRFYVDETGAVGGRPTEEGAPTASRPTTGGSGCPWPSPSPRPSGARTGCWPCATWTSWRC